jgi:hypothetical protein
MSTNQQHPSLVEMLVGTQADLITYQRKHISELILVINQLTAERNTLRDQLTNFQPIEKNDNM